jgi:hypothetical protein
MHSVNLKLGQLRFERVVAYSVVSLVAKDDWAVGQRWVDKRN